MRNFFCSLSLFLAGGYLYGLTEVLFRGYTHWTMFLLGGVCVLLLGALRRALSGAPVWILIPAGGFTVTAAEFLCGMLVNRVLGMGVWDYSDMPGSLLGQICLPFSAVWCVFSLPAMGLDFLHRRMIWMKPSSLRYRGSSAVCRPEIRTAGSAADRAASRMTGSRSAMPPAVPPSAGLAVPQRSAAERLIP